MRSISRTEWIVAGPILVICVFVVLGLLILPPLYVFFGTSVPGLVNEAGEKGPVSTAEKVESMAIWLPWAVFLGCGVWLTVRRRFSRPYLAIDSRGVWPVHGKRIVGGLEWKEIAAVHTVTGSDRTRVPATDATPPFLEVFPIDAIKDGPAWAAAVDVAIVNSPPPARGLRGKRYVFELAAPVSALDDAIERFAAGKRLSLPPEKPAEGRPGRP